MSSRRRQRRFVVSCGKCGANFDASGADPRCPVCNARLADHEPSEARTMVRGFERDLEGPELMNRTAPSDETAPAEDFVAAGLILLSVCLVVAAVFMASPLLLNGGLATFAIAGVSFGIVKLVKVVKYGRQRRPGSFDETPSMMDWLIGRGFWDRFR